MFIFLLQLRHMLGGHPELYLFAVYSALIWGLWILKLVLSARYRPATAPHYTSASVVIPVVDEPVELFREVLQRIVAQQPAEVIVVINGARNPALEQVSDEFAPLVTWTHTPIAGKRNAVAIGTRLSRGDITVLVDSDTVWTDGTLVELVKPFADPRVGGVTTRQRILAPERSWITRWADWLENSRSLYSMPAQSALGRVGCLPGRTIAFRRSILMKVMPQFLSQRFLGVFLEISDDRTLTNLTLKAGYRTVYQHTSLVYTDAPLALPKLAKQQLRWARGSQYNTLRMLPWMLGHAPVLAVFLVLDIVLPFLLAGVVIGWAYRAITGQGENLYEGIIQEYGFQSGLLWVLALMVVGSVLSMAIRQLRHLAERPADLLRLPGFIIFSTLFLMPIRMVGFFRMAHVAGWGTRAGAYRGSGGSAGSDGGGADVGVAEARTSRPGEPAATALPAAGSGGAAVITTLRPTATALTAAPPVHRRFNPLAAVPYLLGAGLIALEVTVLVSS